MPCHTLVKTISMVEDSMEGKDEMVKKDEMDRKNETEKKDEITSKKYEKQGRERK